MMFGLLGMVDPPFLWMRETPRPARQGRDAAHPLGLYVFWMGKLCYSSLSWAS